MSEVYLVKETLTYSDGSEKVVHFNEMPVKEDAPAVDESAEVVDEVVEVPSEEIVEEVVAEEAPAESVEETA